MAPTQSRASKSRSGGRVVTQEQYAEYKKVAVEYMRMAARPTVAGVVRAVQAAGGPSQTCIKTWWPLRVDHMKARDASVIPEIKPRGSTRGRPVVDEPVFVVSVEQQLARLSQHMGHDAMQQGPTIVTGTQDGLIKVYTREGQCAARHSPESIKTFKAMTDDLREQRDKDPDGTLCWSRIRRNRKSREAVKIKRCYAEGKEAVRTEADNDDDAESLVEKLEELQAPGVLVLHHYNLGELSIMWVQVGERFVQVPVSGAAAKRIRQTGTRRSLTLMPVISPGSTRAFVWIAKKDTVDTFMQRKKEQAQSIDHMCAEARAGRAGLRTAEAATADDSAAASSSSSEASKDIAAALAEAAAPSWTAGLSAPASSNGATAGGGAEQEERQAAKSREQEERQAAKIRALEERQARRVRAAGADADGFGVGARERLGRLVQGVRLILAGKRPSSRLLSGVGLTEAEVARMGRVKRSREGDKLHVWWDPEDMGRHIAVAEEAEASAVPSVPGANGDTAPGDARAKRARRANRRA